MPDTAIWTQLDPYFGPEGLGFLPDILLDGDPRPVKEQLEDRYRHGGGWRPIQGFRMLKDKTLRFPDDPPYTPSAMAMIGAEQVIFYRMGSLLAVIQPDGKFEVTRVD